MTVPLLDVDADADDADADEDADAAAAVDSADFFAISANDWLGGRCGQLGSLSFSLFCRVVCVWCLTKPPVLPQALTFATHRLSERERERGSTHEVKVYFVEISLSQFRVTSTGWRPCCSESMCTNSRAVGGSSRATFGVWLGVAPAATAPAPAVSISVSASAPATAAVVSTTALVAC